jgi:glycerol-3-phosphate O-acyltransferase
MDGLSLRERYGSLFEDAGKHSIMPRVIDETNVYQEENPIARKAMDNLVRENLMSGSRIEGRENFESFYRQIKEGKHGIMFSEHYSNLDLPCLTYLLENDGSELCKALGSGVITIAGMKLNESDYRVKAMAEAYTRIVIYPQRSLSVLTPEQEEEEARGRKINMAAMRALDKVRREGRPILVFPSGTRYRPGKPETKRGLRGVDSYLRLFDIMILVTINGQCLRFSPDNPEDMLSDQIFADKVIVAASPVIECKKFRNDAFAETAGNPDIDQKQYAVDKLTDTFETQHAHYEKIRLSE